jgi:hypothetical protein
MEFAAPWDKLLKITTVFVCALIFFVVGLPPYKPDWILLVKAALPFLVLLFSWLWAPRAYRIEGNEVIVLRNFGQSRIPLPGLKSARMLDKTELRGTIRTFGVGGLFGYFGKFYSTKLGSQTWYVTDRSRVVLLDTARGKYLLSPDNPETFLSLVSGFVR